jgi:PAS domain S-box-containing protein
MEKEVRVEKTGLAEESYRAIFDTANDAIFVHDMETGKILDVNRKMCEMYGYTRKEARLLSVEALSSGERPYTQEEAIGWIKKAAGGEPQLFEWLAKAKDGRLFWVEVNLKRAFIGGKNRLLAIVRDISERKRSEEQLKHTMEFNRLLTYTSSRFINLPIDQMDEWATEALERIGEFAHVDRSYIFRVYDGGERMDNTHEWCAERVSSHVHRLKGLSVKEFSWVMDQLKRGEACHVSRVADLPPEAAVEKEEWQFEGIQSIVCVPMLLHGELIGFVGFDSVRQEKVWNENDITLLKIVGEILSNALDRKRAEEALRESEARFRLLAGRLEQIVEQKVAELRQAQSLAAIGQMVSVVAHEVRNPLQSIRMGMDILNLETKEERRTESLTEIESGVNLLNEIITELLEYARPVQLRYSFHPVRSLVEKALKVVAHQLKGVVVSLDLEQGEREIAIDSTKFAAVLVNLITNAVEAMPEGGRLHISSSFGREDGTEMLTLSVTDTGKGIAKEDLQRIQEPFVTTKMRGTGLGLPICRKIIEAHNGRMQIRSRLNEGTTVEITIPA